MFKSINTVKKTPFLCMSWLPIYLSLTYLLKNQTSLYVIFSTLILFYYLFLPALKESHEDFKGYLKEINCQLNLTSFIISFIYLLVLTISLATQQKIDSHFYSYENHLLLKKLLMILFYFSCHLLIFGIISHCYNQHRLANFFLTILIFTLVANQTSFTMEQVFLLTVFLIFLSQSTRSIIPGTIFHLSISTESSYVIFGSCLISFMIILFAITKKSKRLD